MVWRQLDAAMVRSGAVSSTWTSFSASAKVVAETCGPAPGPVPKAGGMPAGGPNGCWVGACAGWSCKPIVAPSSPIDVVAKKSLRDSDIFPPETVSHCIASGQSFGARAARRDAIRQFVYVFRNKLRLFADYLLADCAL